MAPPPSTPTPRRFLVPKRSATQRTETPTGLYGGATQFQATPRFSLNSTPREPGPSHTSSTPAAAPASAFVRQRHSDDINDAIGSSPPVLPKQPYGLDDLIEVESVVASSNVSGRDEDLLDEGDDEVVEPRAVKRRRLSLSSASERDEDASPARLDEDHLAAEEDEGDCLAIIDEDDNIDSDADQMAEVGLAPQPTFQKAPRFKPNEQVGETRLEPLPDAFSPRRRGAKFVPGGLAAELRDWLIGLEAGTGEKKEDEWIARILVEDVKTSPCMTLIKGRQVYEESELQVDGSSDRVNNDLRMVLAGQGRLTGLAVRSEVTVGSLVGIAKPIWDVDLGNEGRWIVGCDWVVL